MARYRTIIGAVLLIVAVAGCGDGGPSDMERARDLCTDQADLEEALQAEFDDSPAAVEKCIAEFEALPEGQRDAWLDAWEDLEDD